MHVVWEAKEDWAGSTWMGNHLEIPSAVGLRPAAFGPDPPAHTLALTAPLPLCPVYPFPPLPFQLWPFLKVARGAQRLGVGAEFTIACPAASCSSNLSPFLVTGNRDHTALGPYLTQRVGIS